MNRRELLRGAVLGGAVLALRPALAVATGDDGSASAALAALERRHGGRLGVAMLDLRNGRRASHRGDERFLMCSTFKLPLVACVLARVDAGKEHLERRVVFDQSAVLDWAPVTRLNVGAPGMTIADLCAAALTISDNTAANLLLQSVGGPAAVTAFVRTLGDAKTRLDHGEPLVNRHHGEDDTTTPWAMLHDMRRLLLGDALSAASRARLADWLAHNQTGTQDLRAGLPSTWRVGDKTGSGNGVNNDVAIVWPPQRQPVLVTAFYQASSLDTAARKAVLADVGRVLARL